MAGGDTTEQHLESVAPNGVDVARGIASSFSR
jgi:hypothetical protein